MSSILRLREAIAPLRDQLVAHPVYRSIHNTATLRCFLGHHVFAVWDFMSLLKALQRELTCTTLPWLPVGDADTRYLINEIVTGEESDVDAAGKRISHFELYLEAMRQAGADTRPMDTLIARLREGRPVAEALAGCGGPAAALSFSRDTFRVVEAGKAHVQAAVFTFGREDLIPGMFVSFVRELNERMGNRAAIFQYYLERHIEVDGDHHSHLAEEMTARLCGNDAAKWAEATTAVQEALASRLRLWDGIAAANAATVAEPAE
jgi:hypothetical protein